MATTELLGSAEPKSKAFARRQVLAWAMYDWANSAFACTVMAGFFPVFFAKYWSAGAESTLTTLRLGNANGIAGFVIAALAPLLGAAADRGGTRVRLLTFFTLLGALGTAALYWVGKGEWQLAVAMYTLGSLGFSGGIVFYDSLLLDVAEGKELDRVSAYGYSLGYLGGGLLFALNVVMTLKPELFGLANDAEAVRVSFLTVAVWWLVFSIPILLFVRERIESLHVVLDRIERAQYVGSCELVARHTLHDHRAPEHVGASVTRAFAAVTEIARRCPRAAPALAHTFAPLAPRAGYKTGRWPLRS